MCGPKTLCFGKTAYGYNRNHRAPAKHPARRATAVLLKRWKTLLPRLKNLQHIANGKVSGLQITWIITMVILHWLPFWVFYMDSLIHPHSNHMWLALSSLYRWGNGGQESLETTRFAGRGVIGVFVFKYYFWLHQVLIATCEIFLHPV